MLTAAWLQAHRIGVTRSQSSAHRMSACRPFLFNPYVVRFLGWVRLRALRRRPALVVAYATVSGNTRNYAVRLATLLSAAFAVELMNVEEYSTAALKSAAVVVQLTSTYGSGAPPTTARKWLTYLTTTEAKQARTISVCADPLRGVREIVRQTMRVVQVQALKGKPWATLGFGSKQYPRFCAAADLFAQIASEAGVQSMLRIGKCDAEGNEEAAFRGWVSSLLHSFRGASLLSEANFAALDSQVRPRCLLRTLVLGVQCQWW